MTAPIETNPAVMLGKPVIRGTRITVELILRKLADAVSITDVLQDYPHLTADDIRAAVTYAADTLAHEETIVIRPALTGIAGCSDAIPGR